MCELAFELLCYRSLICIQGHTCHLATHESEVKVKVAQSCPTLCDLMDCTVHGFLQARILEWVAVPFSGDLPNPGTEPRSPTLQVDSLPAESHGKPENTGVGSHSLLQGIFPTQELNCGFLHGRRILYQLSYEGSPATLEHLPIF